MTTATAQTPAFDATVYDLPIPKMDGHKADHLALVFTGTIVLDRTNHAHLDLLNRYTLGETVALHADAVCVGKPATYRPANEGTSGELTIRTVLRITNVHQRPPLDA